MLLDVLRWLLQSITQKPWISSFWNFGIILLDPTQKCPATWPWRASLSNKFNGIHQAYYRVHLVVHLSYIQLQIRKRRQMWEWIWWWLFITGPAQIQFSFKNWLVSFMILGTILFLAISFSCDVAFSWEVNSSGLLSLSLSNVIR